MFNETVIEKWVHALSLASRSPVQISASWPSWPRDELFYLGPCNSYSSSSRMSGCSSLGVSAKVGQTEISAALRVYKIMDKNPEIRRFLRVPISRWITSMTTLNFADQIIDLGIAFETLYLSGIGEKGELSFRLRVYAAWYLGEDVKTRERLLTIIKQIYDCRSRAVHDGTLAPKNIKFGEDNIPMYQFIRETRVLCLISIMKIIDEGRIPDWNNLILGGTG